MIDPSMTNIHPYPPTMQELEQRYRDLETEINRLNSELENITADRDFWRDKNRECIRMIDNLEAYIKDQFDYIDENISQSIVDIFGFNITKDYDVTITVTFSGIVTAPLNFDMDSLEDSLNASLEASYYSDLEADFSEDRMEIDWTES
jgi:chromosome segregation ATPase